MQRFTPLLVAVTFGALLSPGLAEDKPAKLPLPPLAQCLAFFTDTKGAVYTEWEDLKTNGQRWSTFTKDDHVAIRNEGRVREGSDQYRKAFKKRLPGLVVWCRTAETEEDFAEVDVKRTQQGYVLVSVQSFLDVSGTARFQCLWVKVAEPSSDATG